MLCCGPIIFCDILINEEKFLEHMIYKIEYYDYLNIFYYNKNRNRNIKYFTI